MKTDAIVICGPTATGKTHAGVIVAHENNGEIISADSRQVYRELNIGSGKDIDEYGLSDGAVAYHCIDIADPADTYTLYRYMNDFSESYKGITQKGKLPVIVGGSGLYVEGALKGYSVPEAPENPALRESLMMKETAELLDLLKKYPEIEAQTDHTSKKRIVRAIEIGIAGGRSDIKKEMSKPENPFVIGISFPREELHARIYSRLHERLDHGMIEEVESLTKKIEYSRLMMFGMEYRHIARYVSGEITKDEMKEILFCEIKRLAKRQMTWFRGMERRGIPICWIDRGDITAIRESVRRALEGE